MPDWFKEQKRQANQKREQERVARGSREAEVGMEEMERLLAEVRSG
ncbi:hypothetical protein [Lentibacillus salicampi]|nr:hypothetical protein [Lentibacillus salicampi]